jgi:hypothetical protein
MVGFQRLELALGTALAGEACFDAATRAAYAARRRHLMSGQSVNAAVRIDCSKYLDAELLAAA